MITRLRRRVPPTGTGGVGDRRTLRRVGALEVADFNPDAGTVTVRKSKTGKARHIVLTSEGAEFFSHHCAGRSWSS